MIYLSGLFLFTFPENSPTAHPASNALTVTVRNKICSFLKIGEEFIKDGRKIVSVIFSWSYFLLINDAGEAYLVGYLDGKSNQILKLIPPDKGFIVEAACGIKNCHLVTKEGNYWLFDKSTRTWKNLNQVLNAERPESSIDEDDRIVITKVACGNNVNLAVDNLGSLFSVPSRLDLGARLRVCAVACGKEHSLLLTTEHTVYTWGIGSRGQLGHGSVDDEQHPRQVAALCGLQVTAVAAGGWHSCCVTDQRDLYAWGWNASGQLGFAGEKQGVDVGERRVISVLAEPTAVDWPSNTHSTLYNVSQVACGSRHTVVLLDDNSVWGCGWNRYHQVCAKLPETIFGMSRLAVAPNLKIKQVVCGEWNTAFIAEECN